jgi:hypothetical protein
MHQLSLTAERDVLADLSSEVLDGVRLGEPAPLDSEFDALDSPIGIEEIKAIAEVVTVIAESGVALTALVKGLLGIVKRRNTNVELTTDDGSSIQVTPNSTVSDVIAQISLDDI